MVEKKVGGHGGVMAQIRRNNMVTKREIIEKVKVKHMVKTKVNSTKPTAKIISKKKVANLCLKMLKQMI